MEPLPKQLTLNGFFNILWRQRFAMAVILAVSLIAGFVAFKSAKPVWESTNEVNIAGTPAAPGENDPMKRVGPTVVSADVLSQIEVLESDKMLRLLYASAEGIQLLKGAVFPEQLSAEQRDNYPMVHCEQVPGTTVVKISVDSADPDLASTIAQHLPAIANTYLKDEQLQDLDNAIRYLEQTRLKGEKDEFQQAQKEYQEFKAGRKLPALEGEAAYRAGRVASTRDVLIKASIAVAATEEKLNGLKKEKAALAAMSPSRTIEPNTTQLEAQQDKIDGLRAELAVLQKTYLDKPARDGWERPEIVAKKTEILAAEARLAKLPRVHDTKVSRTHPDFLPLDERIATTRVDLRAAQTEESKDSDEAAIALKEFNDYNKIAPEQDMLHQALLDKQSAVMQTQRAVDELNMRKASSQKDTITSLSDGASMATKVKPKGFQYMLLAFMMGLFVASGFALTKDGMEDKLASADEIYGLTGLPSLGELPALPSRLPVLAEGPVNEAALESYRVLRFNIKFSTLASPVKSIVVTSGGPDEGKTELACNLAIAASGEGRKVILVDANLRNPGIHKKMNVAGKPGLTDVVAGEADLNESMHWTSIPGLRVLTCGSLIATPAEMFASQEMRDVYDKLVADADLVIFDAPSCMAFADTQILSNIAESVLYVARSGKTKRLTVRKGIETLRQGNARILGIATSGVGVKTVKS